MSDEKIPLAPEYYVAVEGSESKDPKLGDKIYFPYKSDEKIPLGKWVVSRFDNGIWEYKQEVPSTITIFDANMEIKEIESDTENKNLDKLPIDQK